MGIKRKNLQQDSVLKKNYVNVALHNTAGYSLSAGYRGEYLMPYNCTLDSLWFANDGVISASNGITVSVCNATNDEVPIALAGNGNFWSAKLSPELVNMTGSLDWLANRFHKVYPSSNYVLTAGCVIHVAISATVDTQAVPIAITLELDPTRDVQ